MPPPTMFVAYDATISPNLADALGYRARRPLPGVRIDACGLGAAQDQGETLREQVRPRIQAADRVIAFVDVAGCNLAVEVGVALALGKPVALVRWRDAAPAWLPGVDGQNLPRLGDDAAIDAFLEAPLDRAQWLHPAPTPAAGGGTLLLAPPGPARRLPGDLRLPWTVLDRPFTLTDVPTLVADAGRVVLVLNAPDDPATERDGAANAANAIVAGYALVAGRSLDVFARTGLRAIAELGARWQRWSDIDALADALRRAHTPTDVLDAWRAHVRDAHRRLLPFFPDAPQHLLDDIVVQVEVAVDSGSGGAGRGPAKGRGGRWTVDGGGRPGGGYRLGDLVEAGARWVVRGDPGAGKSTLARHLAAELAAHTEPRPELRTAPTATRSTPDPSTVHRPPPTRFTPVYVALATLLADGQTPLAWADAALCHGAGCTAGALEARLGAEEAAGRLVLLLDGLDEVPPGRRAAADRLVKQWAKRWPRAAILVLTRPIALERRADPFPMFATAMLQPLTADQQERLVARLVPDRVDAVRSALASPRLAPLLDSPLLLTLAVRVVEVALDEDEPPPRARRAVYDRALRLLLEGRQRGAADASGVKDVHRARHVLGALALRLLQHDPGPTWTRDALRAHLDAAGTAPDVDRYLATWDHSEERFLADLRHNGGVLAPHDGVGQPWRFLHRSLFEVLAAEALALDADALALVLGSRPKRGKAVEAWDARWLEVLGHVLALGDTEAVLPVLVGVGGSVALRAVLGAELAPDHAVTALAGLDDWDGEDLLELAEGWGLPPEWAAETVWGLVTAEMSLSKLGCVHWALVQLGQAPGRERFFRACGRWPEGGPSVPATAQIPGGTFRMGSPEGFGDDDEHPQHAVAVSAFRLATTPVTVAAYRQLDRAVKGADDHPVVRVDFWSAWLFAAFVGGRLPTEAEWEYACRAGTTTAYWSGDSDDDLARVGWFGGNSENPQPVAQKPANGWGLHDMHGNVEEWTADAEHDYPADPQLDPDHPRGRYRVIRGGSAWLGAAWCRSACRSWDGPSDRDDDLGFRFALPSVGPRS